MIFDFGAYIVSVYPSALATWMNRKECRAVALLCFEEKVVPYAPLRYQTHADSRVVEGMYLKFREAFQFKSGNRRYPAVHEVDILQQKKD